jgi:outer membrane receptor for ferrienterochelin and colicin
MPILKVISVFPLLTALLLVLIVSPVVAKELQPEDLFNVSLDELVAIYTASKQRMPVNKAPAIATVITAEEIRNMGARNLLDVLKMVPGVGVSINEFGLYQIEIRGIRTQLSEKVLLMIDGHSMNKLFTGSGMYSFGRDLPVEHIDQVEVIRGPGSALYGANAFVGVINVITKQATDIDGGEMAASYGSFDSRKINVLAGKEYANGLKLVGNVNYHNTDGPAMRIETDVLTGTPFTTTPGYSDLSLEQTDIFLKLEYENLAFRGYYQKKQGELYIGMNYALVDDSVGDMDNYWGELSWNHKWQDNLTTTIKLYLDRYEQESTLKLMPEGFMGAYPKGMIGRPLGKNRTMGGEAQFDYTFSEDNRLIFGMMYEKLKQYDVEHISNFDPLTYQDLGSLQETDPSNINTNREIYAVYLQDEWQLRDDLNLTAGLRYDHYSEFGPTTNPRVALVWGISDSIDLKLLYGQAFRAPTFVELYNQNNPILLGNANLKPEEITTYEAGLGIRLTDFLHMDLNYFYSDIEELIIWDTTASTATYVNGGQIEVDGIELLFTGSYSADNYWKLSYTYQDPRDSDTDNPLPDVPSHRAGFAVNYALTKYLNSHVDVLWTGSRPRAQGDPRPDSDSYTTVDLAFIAKNFLQGFEIEAVVHNLFDEKYQDPDTSGIALKAPDDFPRAGVSTMVTLRYKF